MRQNQSTNATHRDYPCTARARVPVAVAGDILRNAGFVGFEDPLAAVTPSLTGP